AFTWLPGNLVLIIAALVAGMLWGFLYWKSKNLVPCIVSHCLWTVSIFLLVPMI
ncbi:MAG TPA: CPBP family intramembrane metalloprotease, partial [Clostridia bacterium]|nr:CPBP family intramembrane metalloprotease [Clostridia bacterium]